MTTAAMRTGGAKKPPTPEEMIETLKQLGYQVDLPVFPPYIEDMSKVLVDTVRESTLDPELVWRQVAAKLNENHWRPQGRPVESGEQGDHYQIRRTGPTQPALVPTPPGVREGEGEQSVIIAPVAAAPFNLDMDPSQMR